MYRLAYTHWHRETDMYRLAQRHWHREAGTKRLAYRLWCVFAMKRVLVQKQPASLLINRLFICV